LRIQCIETEPGGHVFGYLSVGASRSGISPDIPIHLVAGREPGPTLLVQAAVHGTEIIGTNAVLDLVRDLDPRRLRGNVIAVPVVNRMGFERNDRLNPLDGKDISRLFPGNPKGSLSEQIAYTYFHEVIVRADVMIDLHAAIRGYERYILFPVERDRKHLTAPEQARRKLMLAFGLDAAAFFPPETFGTNHAEEAIAQAGVVMFQPEFGGGTGWLVHGPKDVHDIIRGIRNTMKAMRMIDGEFEWDGAQCTIFNASVVFWRPPVDGLFIRRKSTGEIVAKGAVYATVDDPYTGKVLAELITPTDAVVLPSGQEWPTMGTTTVAILGIVDEVVDRRALDLFVPAHQTR
jgi:predicted deacylase